jgi:hypothetical protein
MPRSAKHAFHQVLVRIHLGQKEPIRSICGCRSLSDNRFKGDSQEAAYAAASGQERADREGRTSLSILRNSGDQKRSATACHGCLSEIKHLGRGQYQPARGISNHVGAVRSCHSLYARRLKRDRQSGCYMRTVQLRTDAIHTGRSWFGRSSDARSGEVDMGWIGAVLLISNWSF